MARLRRLELAAINIKTHPHSSQQYIQLLNDAFNLELPGKIRGQYCGVIGFLKVSPYGVEDGLMGVFYRYMNLDPSEPWLNLKKRKVLEKDEDGKPAIPDHIKPHLKEIPFAFFPKEHRLIFDTRVISPAALQRMLETMFSPKEIVSRHGEVDVIVESSKESIERILKIPRKTRLVIKISKPNPDEGSEDEQRVLKKMGVQNADRMEHVLVSKNEKGLQPSDETAILMRTALSNGVVIAEGRNKEGEKLHESTKKHPYRFSSSYDPDESSLLDALLLSARNVISDLLDRTS